MGTTLKVGTLAENPTLTRIFQKTSFDATYGGFDPPPVHCSYEKRTGGGGQTLRRKGYLKNPGHRWTFSQSALFESCSNPDFQSIGEGFGPKATSYPKIWPFSGKILRQMAIFRALTLLERPIKIVQFGRKSHLPATPVGVLLRKLVYGLILIFGTHLATVWGRFVG